MITLMLAPIGGVICIAATRIRKDKIKNMNNAVVIYDKLGNIWNITYGDSTMPDGLSATMVDIPSNSQLTGIEVNSDGSVTPKYESMPLSDWQSIQKAIDDASNATLEKVNEQLNPTVNVDTLSFEDLKSYKIAESKSSLASYLESHPLVTSCHGGKEGTYTITEDKRNMFTSKFTAHMALVQAGIEDVMTWNEAGKACEPWTDTECLAFIKEWNAISTALVKHQQDIEIAISSCETKDDILKIEITYTDADPRTATETDAN